MPETNTSNPADFTFDRWVDEVFAGKPPDWDWLWENALDPTRAEWLLTYPTRLFLEPDFLVERFSDEQLREGLWNLTTNWELRDSIWDHDLPWPLRRACIRAMVTLFERLFTREPLSEPLVDTCKMWWDIFRYFGDDPDQKVVNEMCLALKEILQMDSLDCQIGALHGLGHLDHPGKQDLINHYLRSHPDLPEEIRSYALASIEGNVL
ncbi:MAG TPA: hypothetical protein VI756_12865 [Blastocatellia bacterium]